MRAADVGVFIRFLINDEPSQAAKARAAVAAGNVLAGTTVLLECDRVLRRVHGLPGDEAVSILRTFASLPGIHMESPDLISGAPDRAENGMDFADALHLGAAAGCEAMPTFDRKFIGLGRNSSLNVREP